jgi:hypothetical protein
MKSGVLFQRWRTFGTDASYSVNVVGKTRERTRLACPMAQWSRWWLPLSLLLLLPLRCWCFYLRVKEFVYVPAVRGGGGRWRSGRVPSVAPPLLHATGACLPGLNPGVVDTEFRSGLGWWQTGCNAMRQVGRGDCQSVCSRPSSTLCVSWVVNS